MMRIAVLFTKLTGYWMAGMREGVKKNNNKFLIFRKSPSADAPFMIISEKNISVNDSDNLKTAEIMCTLKEFNPEILYVSGWIDKRYLSIAKHYRKKGIPTVTGMDNQWLGNFKQHLASYLSSILIKPYFSHIWIAGAPQYYYAKKLGFKDNKIITGLYCADENLFKDIEQTKRNNQFLFIGRLVEHKGLKQLFSVVEELIRKNLLDFKIHIVGNGPLANIIPKHDLIKHTEFVNPKDLPNLMFNAGYLILPSLYEAWGVVVHEAVLAGMPILTTHQTGAASDFVVHNYNGLIYDAYDKNALKKFLIQFSNQSEKEYLVMSHRSKKLATKITLSQWATNINTIA